MANIQFNVPGGLRGKPARIMFSLVGGLLLMMIFVGSYTTYIPPNQVGIKESRLLPPTGIQQGELKGGRIKFLLPGQTIHLFPTDLQVLDLTNNKREVGIENRYEANHRI